MSAACCCVLIWQQDYCRQKWEKDALCRSRAQPF
jgi:hypothetical protein